MDKVRFGRALGYGARHAAKAISEAAKAAATPTANERPAPGSAAATNRVPSLQEASARVADAHRAVNQAVSQTGTRVRSQAATAGRSALAPVRRAGSVLWLELTGTVFALFAVYFAQGLWKLRGGFEAPFGSRDAHKSYLYLIVLLAFVYFAVSSFLRARRRGKRP